MTEFAGVSSLPFSSDHLCVVEDRPRITEVDRSAQSVRLWQRAVPCTSIRNGRNSLDCRAGDPVLLRGRGAEEDAQQVINECQVSIYNQTPSERCVHMWILLQVNVSASRMIRKQQPLATRGAEEPRALSLLWFQLLFLLCYANSALHLP